MVSDDSNLFDKSIFPHFKIVIKFILYLKNIYLPINLALSNFLHGLLLYLPHCYVLPYIHRITTTVTTVTSCHLISFYHQMFPRLSHTHLVALFFPVPAPVLPTAKKSHTRRVIRGVRLTLLLYLQWSPREDVVCVGEYSDAMRTNSPLTNSIKHVINGDNVACLDSRVSRIVVGLFGYSFSSFSALLAFAWVFFLEVRVLGKWEGARKVKGQGKWEGARKVRVKGQGKW